MKRGFTLVELAIALVILGLVIGLGIPLFGLLVKQNKITETRTVVKEVKVSLQGFAQMQGRLPWADTNGDGQEDTNQTTGQLPYLTLGVRGEDAWHTQLYYDVNDQLASSTSLSQFCQRLTQLATNGTADYPQTSSGEMAAVFFSPGENRTPDGQDADISGGSNDRVYEDESKALSSSNDDIVGQLSLSYLAGLLCTGMGSTGCSSYTITNLGPKVYVSSPTASSCPFSVLLCSGLTSKGNGSTFQVDNTGRVCVYRKTGWLCHRLDADGSGTDNGIDFSDAQGVDSNGNCQISGKRSGNNYTLSDL